MTLRFVSSIAASPTVRLDLQDGTTFRGPLRSPDFSPPELKRSVVGSMLRDGESIPASAYANRTLSFMLKVSAATEDALATALQNLHRELDRERNIIEYKTTGQTNSVFFRSFRSPTYQLDIDEDPTLGVAYVGLEILCEPFAYGTSITTSVTTVPTDPSLTNGCYLDVTGILGDAPTPAMVGLSLGSTGTAVLTVQLLAQRSRGTPSGHTFLVQAESLTAGTDTSAVADAAFSPGGAGNTKMRVTFATDTTISVARMSGVVLAGAEGRGRYRVLVRAQRTSGTGAMTIRVRNGGYAAGASSPNAAVNSAVTLALDTSAHLYDLGIIASPFGPDPVVDGYSGTELAVKGTLLQLDASRASGTSNLDVDYFLLIPADESLAIIDIHRDEDIAWFDGTTDALYTIDTADNRIATSSHNPTLAGSLPRLLPGVTNRLYVVQYLGLANSIGTPIVHTLTEAVGVRVTHYPRWLYIRPA